MSGEIPPAQPPPPHLPSPPQSSGTWYKPTHPLSLWRRRHNLLRRRTDRLRDRITVALLLLVPLLGLAATFTVGDAAYRHYRATAEHQRQTRHPTTAVLVHDTPRHPEPGSAEAEKARYPVTVHVTDRHGRTVTARTDVPPGLTAGSTVDVWADLDGTVTEPPMTTAEIRSRTMGWAMIAFLAVAVAGAAVHGVTLRLLLRRDLADWETEWTETAPRWTISHGAP
ncbi:hypothetical protein ABZ490_16800 [Streptomyces sp. NPDC005811]|uniref:Rv1733c family protein n=1 Tax=Streptomyces sp. NPDC005811 TaxID=3154565 RepID=UPI0034115B63